MLHLICLLTRFHVPLGPVLVIDRSEADALSQSIGQLKVNLHLVCVNFIFLVPFPICTRFAHHTPATIPRYFPDGQIYAGLSKAGE